jgi:hypothetical protein
MVGLSPCQTDFSKKCRDPFEQIGENLKEPQGRLSETGFVFSMTLPWPP